MEKAIGARWLRFLLSEGEERKLARLLHSRGFAVSLPAATLCHEEDGIVIRTVRDSTRVILGSYGILTLIDVVVKGIVRRQSPRTILSTLKSSTNLRTSSSLAGFLALYRLVHHTLLRIHSTTTQPFARLHTSPPVSSLVTASIASTALILFPEGRRRQSLALYILFKALETLYDTLHAAGKLPARWDRNAKSWWFIPPSLAHLLHAFIFYPTSLAPTFERLLTRLSAPYVPPSAVQYLGKVAKGGYGRYYSPTLYPSGPSILNGHIDGAHPGHTRLWSALTRPSEVSATKHAVVAGIGSIYALVKVFNLVYASLALILLRKSPSAPPPAVLLNVFAKTLKSSMLITGGLTTFYSLADILSSSLPSRAFPTSRFYALGFLAGLWGRHIESRALGIYLARTATESMWRVGVERGVVKGRRGGDVMLVAVGMGVLGACYEANRGYEADKTIEGGGKKRAGMEWLVCGLRGDVDRRVSRRNSGHVVFDAEAPAATGGPPAEDEEEEELDSGVVGCRAE
ncbi:hypothetical protein SAICODRAFT_6575 [Saitoella complicata NRRL Y-17804]|uniref:Transmembrane protein 135 N-terminal domain-containing protein n=1 Tax=Saitoella complicata (strain BCRC 22490 / CBS 7301 / JCM 7358 / NBRC 10748 / NRRL Y-17804) TaxID=698492 RepID=A0A0E9NB37_SAICN|nr:uncharacterized protein SAICODRAFT_6575 [Saitoella complicata NRRL Y-17804]ODQ53787.1 hypothetical protein SAICODRAFT_6575 [Saitoella complicata NRRL Y-17804]GAO47018.1 hypothetical protein G7K_1232-t1 [Saitoella complicata NRRL Y-17804]